MNIWDVLLITPLTTALHFFYNILGANLGLAIIALTVALRLILFPLTLPSLKSMRIQRDIKPELDRLKEKYKGDRQKLATAQMELFKQKGVNRLSGCLPQLLQLFILPVLAAVSQFVLSKMMLPAVSQEHKVAHEAKDKKEDFASAPQRQNLFLFPILTLFLGLQFPAGLMLYWFVSTLLQIPQQWLAMRSKSS